MRIMPKFFLVLTRCLPDRWALWTAQAKSLKKWRAGQNKTANTYVIDIEIKSPRDKIGSREGRGSGGLKRVTVARLRRRAGFA
jgi:hypothetical protein